MSMTGTLCECLIRTKPCPFVSVQKEEEDVDDSTLLLSSSCQFLFAGPIFTVVGE